MKLSDLFEATLYRGDSSKITRFEIDKTDSQALLGNGIYLTDSHDVAKDYTTKSGSTTTVETLDQYVGDVFTENLGDIGLRTKLQDAAMAAQNLVYDFMEERQLDDRRSITDAFLWAVLDKNLPLIDKVVKRAKLETRKVVSGKVYRQNVNGDIDVLDKSASGTISEFDIPDAYLEKTYDADAPMDKGMLERVQRWASANDFKLDGSLRYWKNDEEQFAKSFDDWVKKFKEHGMRYAWGDHLVGGDGQNPTLTEFIIGTHVGISMSGKNFWNSMASELADEGYKGYAYQGGVRTGANTVQGGVNVEHRAYVFWNEDELNQMMSDQSGHKPEVFPTRILGKIRTKTIMKQYYSMAEDAKKVPSDIREEIVKLVEESPKTGIKL